ncbi:hypothetical protein NE237_027709 [Protea cynaroides]|uniref:Uncharacterized protein n=1 Tax=Protea cynaroides TaxID=273540 RepID=A0A9Q0GRV9_9MAGN|nr:hypothetical protein NE237_027709 [Protea cynaroides]
MGSQEAVGRGLTDLCAAYEAGGRCDSKPMPLVGPASLLSRSRKPKDFPNRQLVRMTVIPVSQVNFSQEISPFQDESKPILVALLPFSRNFYFGVLSVCFLLLLLFVPNLKLAD